MNIKEMLIMAHATRWAFSANVFEGKSYEYHFNKRGLLKEGHGDAPQFTIDELTSNNWGYVKNKSE